ncbi:MAG: hypothetical protein HC812_08245 [Leptolyngbya sp. RL_3_1]|nr:hypothetical protein [Leptolyngbya sp. RL_3_1]
MIFLSALDDPLDKVKAFEVGGVDYVSKPFQMPEILARVETHLKISRLNRTLVQKNARLEQEIERRQQIEDQLHEALDNLKQTQAQVIAREKLASLGSLTSGIAHELRNPLNFVTNYAEGSMEMLEEALQDLLLPANALSLESVDEVRTLLVDVKENANLIHAHSKRAERVINTMLKQARSGDYEVQSVNFNMVLMDAVNLAYYSKRAQDKDFNIIIEADYDDAINQVEVIESSLSRAMVNIIDNALYAMDLKKGNTPDFKPKLTLRSRSLGDTVEVRVRDNGIGIHLDVEDKIFTEFFTTKPPGQGTGLGLSTAASIIVGQHSGRITYTTEPNTFTEFIITLPRTHAKRDRREK